MGDANRREFLRVTGLGIGTIFAGCIGKDGQNDDNLSPTEVTNSTPMKTSTETPTPTPALAIDPADLPGYVRPGAEPEIVPQPLTCEDESLERRAAEFDGELRWGAVVEDGRPVFAMRVNDLAFERGDEVRVTLTNVRDEERVTGNRAKYYFQVFTEDGWQEVRVLPEDRMVAFPGERNVHEPGESYEWALTLTETELLDGYVHEEEMEVCPGLPAGRYRFVYWGVDHPVAVAFDLRD